MLHVRLAGDHLYWEIAVHLVAAADVYDGVFLCCPFSHEMPWMRSGTKSSQFLRVFLPTLLFKLNQHGACCLSSEKTESYRNGMFHLLETSD